MTNVLTPTSGTCKTKVSCVHREWNHFHRNRWQMESVSCVIVKRVSLPLQSSHSLFCALCVSLTVPPWNPWINNSSHRFFILWLNMIFIPSPILPPTHLSEGAHKTLYVSSPETQTRLCKKKSSTFLFFHLSRIISWALKCCLSTTWVALFSRKHPPSSFLLNPHSHPPPCVALDSTSCRESETVTDSNKKASDLDTSLHLNNGATWYESLVIRALLAHCVLHPIRQWGKRGRSRETGRGERSEEGGYGSVITAMGLMDVWGLNWLPMTAEASPCFYQLSAGFPPLLSLCLSPYPPLLFSASPL